MSDEKRTSKRSPNSPPPLTALSERKTKLKANRAEIFKVWKKALEDADGNVSRAAEALGWSRDRGNTYTRRLGLKEWAASLRIAHDGKATGRPKT